MDGIHTRWERSELGGEIIGDEERDFANVPGIGPRKLSGFTNGHIPDCFKGNEWSRGRGTPCGIQGDTRAWQAVCGSHDEDWMVEATIKSYNRIEEVLSISDIDPCGTYRKT